jgi:hypothetical protein
MTPTAMTSHFQSSDGRSVMSWLLAAWSALVMISAGCQQASVASVAVSTAGALPIYELTIEASFGAKDNTVTLPRTPSSMVLAFPVQATILLPTNATGMLTITARGYDVNRRLIASGQTQTRVTQGRSGSLSIVLAGVENDLAPPSDLLPRDMSERPCLYELCEGFESGTLNTSVWSQMIGDTSKMNITVDNTVAHSGSRSLHLHSDALTKGSAMTTLIAESAFVPTTTQPLFVRLWLKAGAWPPIGGPGIGHDALLEIRTAGGNGEALNIEASSQRVDQGNAELLDFLAYNGVPNTVYKGGNTPLATGEWFCLEWSVAYNAQDMQVHSHTWLGDGNLEVALEANASLANFNTLLIGMDEHPTNAQGPIDLWIDDIVISGAYVRCAD